MINKLKENQIFIFGSNLAGRHGGGAAKQAFESFGAEWGVGEGLTGRCYAFPTLDRDHNKVNREDFENSIIKLYQCADENPDKEFLLTKVGCGIAGFNEDFIKILFDKCPKNIIKPEDWK